jgi:hypothetical protein
VRRPAEWGLRTIASWEEQEREQAPEPAVRPQSLRGRKPCKPFLTPFVRQTPCLNEVMRRVQTPGVSVESRPAGQERLGACPARAPRRPAVRHSVQHDRPIVAWSERPIVGASDVSEALLGQTQQRLDTQGRSALNQAILLRPCLGGELTPDLVAEAAATAALAAGLTEHVWP